MIISKFYSSIVFNKVELRFYCDNETLETITFKSFDRIIKLHSLNPSYLTNKTIRVHLIKGDEDYLLRLRFGNNGPNQFAVSFFECFSFFYVSTHFSNPPQTKEAFLNDLGRFPCIKEEKALPFRPLTQIPHSFELKKITIHLSQELICGIQGNRGEDHHISIELLKNCLEIKERKLKSKCKKAIEEVDLYFKYGNQILNIFVKKFDQTVGFFPKIVVISAYYMPFSSIKHRFQFSEAQLTDWLHVLPSIYIQKS